MKQIDREIHRQRKKVEKPATAGGCFGRDVTLCFGLLTIIWFGVRKSPKLVFFILGENIVDNSPIIIHP